MKRGWLIAFEGVDGCGKSTQLVALAETLRAGGHDVLETREPTDGPFGRRIRAMARGADRVPAEEELGWFVADRREHVRDTIRPALVAGRVVLTDRYYLSTVAYQGARGLDPARLLAESEAEFPEPDLALLLDIDPDLGLERVRGRGGSVEPAFEDADYLSRVAAIFRGLACAYLERVDAGADPSAVRRAILTSVRRRLGDLLD